jgi:hypothetical protein
VPPRRAYNGHLGCGRYHPLFVLNQFGDVEGCAVNARTAPTAGAPWLKTPGLVNVG